MLQCGLSKHVVRQVAGFEEAKNAYKKEDDNDRGQTSAAFNKLTDARDKLVDGLSRFRSEFVAPLLTKVMSFVEAQTDCVRWAAVCKRADYLHMKTMLETISTWKAPTFTADNVDDSLSRIEEFWSCIPLDFSSSNSFVATAGKSANYCLSLFR